MDRIDSLLKKQYWIIDIFPKQVPDNARGQYFTIEKYYMRGKNLADVQEKKTNIILKINCYYDIFVDGMGDNPDPESLSKSIRKRELNILTGNSLIVTDPDDTYMTLYNPDQELLELMRTIAMAEGLFVWKP